MLDLAEVDESSKKTEGSVGSSTINRICSEAILVGFNSMTDKDSRASESGEKLEFFSNLGSVLSACNISNDGPFKILKTEFLKPLRPIVAAEVRDVASWGHDLLSRDMSSDM